MAKKRRTELDVDPALELEPEEEQVAEPAGEEPPKPAPEEPKAPEKSPKPKVNKTKLAMIIGGALVLAVLGGFIVWMSIGVMDVEEEKPKPKPEDKVAELAIPTAAIVDEVKVDLPLLYKFEPFLVPVGKKGAQALVKIAFAVEMSEDDVKKEIDRNLVLIRENIYFLLRNKSVTVFKNKRALNRVASEIAVSLNRSIQSGAVLNTYVTRLTIQ